MAERPLGKWRRRDGNWSLIKQRLLNLLRVSGTFDLMRLITRRSALILTYHRFSCADPDGKASARPFAAQVDSVAAHCHVVSPARMASSTTRLERSALSLGDTTLVNG